MPNPSRVTACSHRCSRPTAIAAFARATQNSSKQVWSKHEGLSCAMRTTVILYTATSVSIWTSTMSAASAGAGPTRLHGHQVSSITGHTSDKAVLMIARWRLRLAGEHAGHFLGARIEQVRKLAGLMDRPAAAGRAVRRGTVRPHGGMKRREFIDAPRAEAGSRSEDRRGLITSAGVSRTLSRPNQIAAPRRLKLGRGGYWRVWLNESNAWIYPHLRVAQERMSALVRSHGRSAGMERRALQQAGRELLLCASHATGRSSCAPGTTPIYARQRIQDHLPGSRRSCEQLTGNRVDDPWLKQLEQADNLFPDVNPALWA